MACSGITFGNCNCTSSSGGGGGDPETFLQFGRVWTGLAWRYINGLGTGDGGFTVSYKVPKTGVYSFITAGNFGAEASLEIPGRDTPLTVRFGGRASLVAGTIVRWFHGGGDGTRVGYYEVFATTA
jgi:hypothetical protein